MCITLDDNKAIKSDIPFTPQSQTQYNVRPTCHGEKKYDQ